MIKSFRNAAQNGGRWLVVAATVCAVSLATVAGVVLYDRVRSTPTPYAPLYFPGGAQTVATKVVPNGSPVEVNGRRCSSAPKTVVVHGYFSWVSVTPAGVQYQTTTVRNAGARLPGCQNLHFINDMPAQVKAENALLFSQGLRQVSWRLEGTTVPINPETGRDGVPAYWHTQTFTVVP